MVLSHHPPSQYDRTLHVAGLRLCARGVGVVAGILAAIPLLGEPLFRALSSPAVFASLSICTLVFGISAFVLNEDGRRKSSNYERMAFGVAIGMLFPLALASSVWHLAMLIALVVAGQFASALALRKLGILDRFFAEYLSGAMILPEDTSAERNESCGRFFCACSQGSIRLPKA